MSDQAVEELEPSPEPGVVYAVSAPAEEAAPVPAEEAAPAPPAHRLPALWRNRDYMFLWGGQVISTLGSAISGVVFPLLILALTNSPEAAGIATALATIPYVLFSLPAGALVDRWNRKRVMILCDTGRAISLASVPLAMAFGVLTIWQLYVNAFIEGTLFVFFNIAEVAALPRVVPKAQLPAATAQNESAFATAGLIGPSLGGFLFQTVGRAAPFVIDAFSYVVSVISLLTIRTAFQTERAPVERNLRAEIVEGVHWLWRQRLIRFMAFLTGGLNFVNAGMPLIIIVLAKQMGAGEAAIGSIFSIASIGGILGAVAGGPLAKRFSFAQVIITTVWIEALLIPFYLVAPNIVVLGVIGGLSFFTGPIYNVKQFSYRVALIPDALQGRVNSAFRLLAFGFQPLGAALAGVLLERAGVAPAIVVFAVWTFGLAILAALNGHVRRAGPVPETA